MAGSNDLPTRKLIFEWIEANEKTLYSTRTPIDPVGVYFSHKSRDYDAAEFSPVVPGHARRAAPGAPRIPGSHAAHACRIQRQEPRPPQRHDSGRHRKGRNRRLFQKRRPPDRHRCRHHRIAAIRRHCPFQGMPSQSLLRSLGEGFSVGLTEAAIRFSGRYGREVSNRSRRAGNRSYRTPPASTARPTSSSPTLPV